MQIQSQLVRNYNIISYLLHNKLIMVKTVKSSVPKTQRKQELQKRFYCTCGMRYQSQPAVYTHIKNKHKNDKSNYRVIDSTKGQIENNRAYRLEYIQYNPTESSLMTLADRTFIMIANHLKENQLKIERYLQDDDFLSDSEEEPNVRRVAQREINAYVAKYTLADFFQGLYKRFERQLESFKIHSYRLNIRTELSKFFKQEVAWKIEAQVLLYFAKLIDSDHTNIKACQLNLWKPAERDLEEFIEQYCRKWRETRG